MVGPLGQDVGHARVADRLTRQLRQVEELIGRRGGEGLLEGGVQTQRRVTRHAGHDDPGAAAGDDVGEGVQDVGHAEQVDLEDRRRRCLHG